jgi:hypothetical protein
MSTTRIRSSAPCPKSTLALANAKGFASFLALNVLYGRISREGTSWLHCKLAR